MTRPPPFSPLSVCPKPLPSPKPFGTRMPAQAAGSKPLLRPVFPTEGAKEQGYCLFYHIFPVNARALRLFLQRKPAQTICAGGERLSKLARAPAYANAAQSAAIRGDAPASYGVCTGTDRAMAQVGPRPAPRALHAERGGAPVRGRLTFHDGNGQPLRLSQRSSRSSRRPAVQKGRWRPHSRPPHKRRSRSSVLRRSVRFFGAFCSPLSCFSVRQYSIIQT